MLTEVGLCWAVGPDAQLMRRYIIPGGSAGRFQRDGYVLDVGASMMFGMGDVRPASLTMTSHLGLRIGNRRAHVAVLGGAAC